MSAARTLAALVAWGVLQGCGGGGGGSAAAPTPAGFSIGGTVSGLTGSVTLQNNAGDSLTLTANGPFGFATRVAAGSSYTVTVSAQPEVPDCVVTGGAGVANGNVSNIAVACAVSRGSRFIPMRADRPLIVPCGLVCASSAEGLFVFSTRRPDRAPVRITPEAIDDLAVVPELTVTAGAVVADALPATLLYRTVGGADPGRLWALDLRGGSTLAPRQVGSLALRAGVVGAGGPLPALCGAKMLLRKLDDPESAMLILLLGETAADPDYPCAGSLRRVMVKVTDTPTTAPRDLAPGTAGLQPLYRSDGVLAGVLDLDYDDPRFMPFAGDAFGASQSLPGGSASLQVVRDQEPASWSGATWTDLMGPQSSLVFTREDADSRMLYRIDHDGSVHLLHDVSRAVQEPVRFGANLYVQDQDIVDAPTLLSILRIPVNGGARQTLLAHPPEPGCYLYDSIVGTWAQGAIVWRSCWSGTQVVHSEVLSVPGAAPDAPRRLARYPTALAGVAVAQDRVLVSFEEQSAASNPPYDYRFDRATAVLDTAGQVLLPRAPGAFLTFHADPADGLLQVRDVTASGLDGGVVYRLDLRTSGAPALSRLTYPDGSDVRLPDLTQALDGTAVVPGLVFSVFSGGVTGQQAGVVDLARGRMVKLNPAGVNLQLVGLPERP